MSRLKCLNQNNWTDLIANDRNRTYFETIAVTLRSAIERICPAVETIVGDDKQSI